MSMGPIESAPHDSGMYTPKCYGSSCRYRSRVAKFAATVCTENLNPDVVVMRSAKDRL